MEVAKMIGAYAYVENSALMHEAVEDVVIAAVQAAMDPRRAAAGEPLMPPKPMGSAVMAKDIAVSRAFAPLVGKKEFADVTFVLNDKVEVSAHKVVLSLRMSCFHKAFVLQKGDTLPSGFKFREAYSVAQLKEEPVVIDVDLESSVFHHILDLIYTETPYNGREFAPEVYKEIHDFFSLKNACFTGEKRRKVTNDLLQSLELFSDVHLEIDGNERVPAHKVLITHFFKLILTPFLYVLLTAASEYFAALFTGGMKESRQDVVSLTDLDKSDLTVLLEFLYQGTTTLLTPKNVVKMIYVANKYN
eukprot:TRINITY_DN3442_c0_g2_i1.p1 TRINITY_DN3442_c0_g2~~TRINITY_DN3442_c0_g2_i1.p1  ORF type:complete len:320 (+),score=35.81 TRINITY_DN3442_c0_g2_i1:53-961(+)